ncbi:histidine kinase [Desulfocurvibacter africanus PCS]|uniref:histidine kinase n=1 Tax=Desulfocurvibacter africanus PCS TaxID=1262666 RepID=M5PZC3_DESAF|nr:PAS domain-containing sensor histidine kinase [Desulfocurvibacter africanus]EMG35736.1 histidine kinase [Desulfocurvibacter africanus PCS]
MNKAAAPLGNKTSPPPDLHGPRDVAPRRYKVLRRKFVVIMALVAIVPLIAMGAINYLEFQAALSREVQSPLRALLYKTKNTIELYLAERASKVSFIAQAYGFEDLADDTTLRRIFKVLSSTSEGFVDLGLIGDDGVQVSYTGPYALQGVDYSDEAWFQRVQVKGIYISDVFMGFRRFPHIVIAVRRLGDDGRFWIVRATLDTSQFDKIIAAMGLESDSDAFLLNKKGVLQTNSRYYGDVLKQAPFSLPPQSYEINLLDTTDPAGRDVYMAYTYFSDVNFVLMAVKSRVGALQTWSAVRGDFILIFVVGTILIFLVANHLTRGLVQHLKESDERREFAFREVEHNQRLSSIGRLAAGLAHEVNNPLAIINEQAGLLKDLLNRQADGPEKERYSRLADSILAAVKRCRDITHNMLGFARRMELAIEFLSINEVLAETLSFLRKEAESRDIEIILDLDPNLPTIPSDRGQLQQVFLNILNNALAAVSDKGRIQISSKDSGQYVLVSIEDNGCGMPKETLEHIFEPFFTTKKGRGTGLGLSITYGIVKRLGGDIDVRSTPGQGTTFTVILPKQGKLEERS